MVEELQIVFVFHEVCERPEPLLPSDNWKFSANLDHEHTVVDLRHGAHRVHHQLPPPEGQLGAGLGILEAPGNEVVLIELSPNLREVSQCPEKVPTLFVESTHKCFHQ